MSAPKDFLKVILIAALMAILPLISSAQYFNITLDNTSNQLATSVIVSGDYVFTFSASTINAINKSVLVLTKTDKEGNIIFNIPIEAEHDFMVQKAIEINGEFYCAGQYSFDNQLDFAILKVSSDGSKIWEKSYFQSNFSESFQGITRDSNNNLIVSGYYTDTLHQNSLSVLASKIDTSGAIIWTYVSETNSNEVAMNCAVYSNNDIAIGLDRETIYGYTLVWLRISETGILQNELAIKNNKNRGCKNLIIDENDNTYIVGESYTSTSPAFDITISKITASGELAFDYYLPGTNKGEAGFALRKYGNYLIVAGYAFDSIDANTKLGCYAFENDTTLVDYMFFGESGITFAYDLQVEEDGTFWTCGAEYGDFGGSILVKGTFGPLSTSSNHSFENSTINLFPNPANRGDIVHLDAQNCSEFMLFDTNGKCIMKSTAVLNSTNLKVGTYIVKPINTIKINSNSNILIIK